MKILTTVLIWHIALLVSAEVFIVSNNQDAGMGSLRQAILDSEAMSGKDTIAVNVSGTILLETVENEVNILGAIYDSLCIMGNGIVLETNVGGRFFQNHGDLLVDNVVFRGAFKGASGVKNAGAIWSTVGNAVFMNCTFEDNTASADGGAVRVSGNIMFENCEFNMNNAGSGGAIVMRGGIGVNIGVLTIKNCQFNGNSSSDGNAIYLSFASLHLIGTNLFDAVSNQDISGFKSEVLLDPETVVDTDTGGFLSIKQVP